MTPAIAAPIVSTPPPAPVGSTAPVSQRPSLRPIIFAGHRSPKNVVWTQGGFAAVTHDEVWRVSLRDSLGVSVTQLSRPAGHEAAMGATPTSNVVAVGLDDGSVDVFRAQARVRNLVDRAHEGTVLQINMSGNGRTIAVTRSNGSWPEKTVAYEVDTGTERARLEGGNVVFDDAGAYFTARGGLYEVASGRLVWMWNEGFYVLGDDGMVPVSKIRMGSEMVAQDYTARGFWKGRAVFAGIGDVFLVDPSTGAVTKQLAPCTASKRKLRSHLDGAHGRVIGVCINGTLVTDLATGVTERFAGGKFGDSTFPPDLWTGPETPQVFITARERWVLDAEARTLAIANEAQLLAIDALDDGRRCSGRSMPRVDMPCTTRQRSVDGQYRLALEGDEVRVDRIGTQKVEFRFGGAASRPVLLAPRGTTFDVFDGGGEGAPRYRVGAGSNGRPLPVATSACGKERAYFHGAVEGGTLFKIYAGAQGAACLCTEQSCTKLPVSPGAELLTASADGSVLSYLTNSTITESTLRLRRGGREVATAKIAGNCSRATFAPGGRIFVACAPQPLEEEFLLELHPSTLATLGRRMSPLGTVNHLMANVDTLAVEGPSNTSGTVTLLPLDWVATPDMKQSATLYLGQSGMIVERDTQLTIVGEPAELMPLVRCWNGERLFSSSACDSAFAQ